MINAFVFAIWKVQSLYFPNPSFQVSSHLQWLPSLVFAWPVLKPRWPFFSERGSYFISHFYQQEKGFDLCNRSFHVSFYVNLFLGFETHELQHNQPYIFNMEKFSRRKLHYIPFNTYMYQGAINKYLLRKFSVIIV